ncbi:MAG: hypothetical protein JKY55_09900 [Aliivibrio sp.]|uniref:hypothetical protein n=1 Tax=Aliivibrio sp. TaxID=1872443 RepID=UPI001A3877C5|nr:hypothetical protein [Aliivibrio sp.]
MIDIKACPWCLDDKDWSISEDLDTWSCSCGHTVYTNMYELLVSMEANQPIIINKSIKGLDS